MHIYRFNHLQIKNLWRKNYICTKHTLAFCLFSEQYNITVYIVLGVIYNVEMVCSAQEAAHTFVFKGLGPFPRPGVLQAVGEAFSPTPAGAKGQLDSQSIAFSVCPSPNFRRSHFFRSKFISPFIIL